MSEFDFFSRSFVADVLDVSERLDVFLTKELTEFSRSFVQKLVENGGVTVNGTVPKSNYKLRQGDIINVMVEPPKQLDILPENIPLNILYEDSGVIVIDKPQGMVVHPAAGHYGGTVVNALLYHLGNNLSGINGVLRPGIVHRIDKDTSGVIVVAKTDEAHRKLSLQLSEHTMTRKYFAVVYNNVTNDSGTVKTLIGRHPKDRKKMAVVSENGRLAVTHYNVLERFGKYTLVEAVLETGRTHQIRVHMSYIGHPLLGDPVYGPKTCPFNLNGQALHAATLGFVNPVNDEYMEFCSPLPEHFTKLLKIIK